MAVVASSLAGPVWVPDGLGTVTSHQRLSVVVHPSVAGVLVVEPQLEAGASEELRSAVDASAEPRSEAGELVGHLLEEDGSEEPPLGVDALVELPLVADALVEPQSEVDSLVAGESAADW